jgi:hypothetical protein
MCTYCVFDMAIIIFIKNFLEPSVADPHHIDADPDPTFHFDALQGKSHLCLPFLGIARPLSQFSRSCVLEQFIYSQDQSTYFPAGEYADRSWEYYKSLTDT